MTGVITRSVTREDSAMLAALHRQCFPNYWQHETFTDFFSVRGTFGLAVEKDVEMWRDGDVEKSPVPHIPTSPHPLLAMIVYRILYEQADIITLAVHPDYRRQGIGKDLLARAMTHAAATGAKALFLDVEEGNQAAIQLYELSKFFMVSRRKHYYRQKDGSYTDALVMSRKLG